MLLYIIIGLAVFFGFFLMTTYNKLVRNRTMVEESWSGIDVQLKKRHDLIPNLVNTIKGITEHEKGTLTAIVAARNAAQEASTVKDKQAAENQLSKAFASVFALSEAYPDIKSNENFLQLQRELSNIEGAVEKARRYYNATVRENNILIESFPSNIIANAFNFYLADFFEMDQPAHRALPEIEF